MIDLYTWSTPNGHKVTMFLEETGLPYRIFPVDIGKGEQFHEEFLAIAPNNRIPAIVDHTPVDGGPPLSLFESGAILLYLAEKSGRLQPSDARGRWEMTQWLMWQVAGLGPMAGQCSHFHNVAPEKIPYAITRYEQETTRLFSVLDKRLADRDFLAGGGRGRYSIADIASFPWVRLHERLHQELAAHPHLARWVERIWDRPATQRAYALADTINPRQPARAAAASRAS